MTERDLNYRIRMLVEGAQEVQRLGDEVQRTQNRAGQQVPDSTRDYRRGVRESTQAQGSMTNGARRLRQAIVALGVGLAVRRIHQFARATLQAAEQLQTTADRLSLTTSELEEYRFAARQVNVEQRTLELGLQRFSRRLAEARDGSGELADTLENYGIALRDANGQARESGEVLRDLADATRDAEDGNEQLRISFKAFDSEGAALVNLMRQGREGLNGYAQEARDLGEVTDANLVRRTAEMSRELRNVGSSVRSIVSEGFMSEFVGDTGELSELVRDPEFQQSMRDIGGLIGTVAEKALWAATQVGNFIGMLRSLGEEAAATMIGDHTVTLERARARRESLRGRLDQATERSASGALIGSVIGPEERAEIQAEIDELDRIIAEREAAIEALEARGRGDDTPDVDGDRPRFTRRDPADEEALQRRIDLMEEAQAVQDSTRNSQERFNAELDLYNRLLGEGLIGIETWARAVEQAEERLHGVEDAAEDAGDGMEELSQFSIQAARNIQSAFADFLFDPFEEGVEGLADNFIRALRRLAAEVAAQRILTGMFGGEGEFAQFLGQAMGMQVEQNHGGGIAGSGSGATRNVNPAVFAGARRFHRGGLAANEVPAILEREEEVLTRDDPRHRANMGSGGGSVKVEVINRGQPQQVRGNPEARQTPEGMIISLLLEDQEQGGPVTSGFASTFGLQRGGGNR